MKIPSEGAIEDKLTFGGFYDNKSGAYSMDIGPVRKIKKNIFKEVLCRI